MAPGAGPPTAGKRGSLLGLAPDALDSEVQKPDGSKALQSWKKEVATSVNEEMDEQYKAAKELKEFCIKAAGSVLRAWCKHFDQDNDQKITSSEFMRAMRNIGFKGDSAYLFERIDGDRSGELSLEEICPRTAELWRHFRNWCVVNFEDVQDFLKRLGAPEVKHEKITASNPQKLAGGPVNYVVTEQQFIEGLRQKGWMHGYEDKFFAAINIHDKAAAGEDELKWLDIEKRRQKRKEMAKRKALMDNTKRQKDNSIQASLALLADFKQFLKRKYGNYVRAWRAALSPDGSMVLQRSVLFKACTNIGWPGDVRLLYRAFDKDDSGYVSIEELDAKAAELLAHFREFMGEKFGSASATFKALDKFNQNKLKQPEFVNALKSFGFKPSGKALFQGLDHRGLKALVEEDFLFLDRWKPPAYLTRAANLQAMEDLKACLIKEYKNYLKAWRHLLDLDSSNRCNYDEFEAACKKINFRGDVPGAWRALDEDLSGFITLSEIDGVSSQVLASFRHWCDQEFGSVRSAFGVFDASGDNEVTLREWRRSCRIYGFEGQAHILFHALDVEKNGSLSVEEVDFLDGWDFPKEDGADEDDVHSFEGSKGSVREPSGTTEYITDTPGPGTYRTVSTMGAGPLVPTLKFSGAYSLRRKNPKVLLPGVQKDAAQLPSPGSYDDLPCLAYLSPTKPSWQFAKAPRAITEGGSAPPAEAYNGVPGPGQYAPTLSPGRSVACTPRRPLKVHPLFSDAFKPNLPPVSREVSHSLSPRKGPSFINNMREPLTAR
eukprot:TRINITY_DN5447_c0_g1_i4.p1 TRINITY_DN5447_c0_g1~~TRINITY_DN5447_c0_g1_i4.p1  ORF type:complete len:774 (+),score=163.57 TRINITY_DN5447_c0_g1_i4:112-2433(+)